MSVILSTACKYQITYDTKLHKEMYCQMYYNTSHLVTVTYGTYILYSGKFDGKKFGKFGESYVHDRHTKFDGKIYSFAKPTKFFCYMVSHVHNIHQCVATSQQEIMLLEYRFYNALSHSSNWLDIQIKVVIGEMLARQHRPCTNTIPIIMKS